MNQHRLVGTTIHDPCDIPHLTRMLRKHYEAFASEAWRAGTVPFEGWETSEVAPKGT